MRGVVKQFHLKNCKGNIRREDAAPFAGKGPLNKHMVVHNGELFHQCDICKMSFTNQKSLKTHMAIHQGFKVYTCDKCGKSYKSRSRIIEHERKCTGQSSSLENETVSISEIQFVDYGETIKQEIKEENEIEDDFNPLDYLKSEHAEDIVESGEISLESEIEAESINCKETIKLEIKREVQKTEDLQDPLSTEDLILY